MQKVQLEIMIIPAFLCNREDLGFTQGKLLSRSEFSRTEQLATNTGSGDFSRANLTPRGFSLYMIISESKSYVKYDSTLWPK